MKKIINWIKNIFKALFCNYKIQQKNKVYEIGKFRYKKGSIEARILLHMNAYRIDYGLKPLVGDRFSNIIAGTRVKDMIAEYSETGEISHFGAGKRHSELIKLGADCVGENIAYGYITAQGVVRAWYKSPGHRKNMLNPRYDWTGIYVEEHLNRNYFCCIFGGEDIVN